MPGRLFTSESVTEGHPDKIADRISDTVLDYLMEHDSDPANLRTAVETMGGATFVARPELHCSGDYSFGQCAIHVIPEVTE